MASEEEVGDRPRRPARRAPAARAGRRHRLHALGRAPLLDLRRLPRPRASTLVDTRHEATAAFAAEGWAKVTRAAGRGGVTAGPGRDERDERDGRRRCRATRRWSCSAAARPRCAGARGRSRRSTTCRSCARCREFAAHGGVARGDRRRSSTTRSPPPAPPGGPAFVDFPLDHVFSEGGGRRQPAVAARAARAAASPTPTRSARALRCCPRPSGPVVMAGSGLWWGHGEPRCSALRGARGARLPQRARPRVRARRPPLSFSRRAVGRAEGRRRRARDRRADGLPARVRRRVRRGHGDRRRSIARSPSATIPRPPAAELYGALPATLARAARPRAGPSVTGRWVATLREQETAAREAEAAERADYRAPLHPMRLYGSCSR